jgi:hypothetical protein
MVPIERSCQFVTRNTQMKCENPITYHSAEMANVKASNFKVKVRTNIMAPVQRSCHKEHTREV